MTGKNANICTTSGKARKEATTRKTVKQDLQYEIQLEENNTNVYTKNIESRDIKERNNIHISIENEYKNMGTLSLTYNNGLC